MRQVTAKVRGMHCAGCVGKVERALRSMEGVAEAKVNLVSPILAGPAMAFSSVSVVANSLPRRWRLSVSA
jgi:copper chaperone CopZ